jgi:hypothetical protein
MPGFATRDHDLQKPFRSRELCAEINKSLGGEVESRKRREDEDAQQ